MTENISFTERAITEAQKRGFDLKAAAITDYLLRNERLVYDFAHRPWLVNHPSQGWQVAVWMMEVCEPAAEKHK